MDLRPEKKVTHFYVRQEADILQNYIGTTLKKKKKILNPEKFVLGGPKLGMEQSFVCLSKKGNPLLD
jgi:hypothetical protein